MKTKFASLAAASPAVDMRSGTALVVAEGLKRHYPQGQTTVVALASATCRIGPGQRIAIVGPSGSGKSTLLHLLGGLDVPSGGTICWPALGPRERLRPGGVAFVLQTPSLLPPLTVAENVELPLLLQGIVMREARAQALDVLERLDLISLVDKLPEELSGGQAQRVAIARALVGRPRLLLADEPTGQLDHATAQHMFDVLLRALDDTNTALVIATHDLEIAARLDQVWYMRHGILEQHQ